MAVRSAAVKGAIVRDFERSAHLGYVIVFIAIIIVLGLGLYEALAAIIDPRASVVGPIMSQLISGGGVDALAAE
jgi:hypothetical protein